MLLDTPGEKYGSPYRPGTYTVTITGTVDDVDDVVPGTSSKTATFDFTLTDPCDPPMKFELESEIADLDYTIT